MKFTRLIQNHQLRVGVMRGWCTEIQLVDELSGIDRMTHLPEPSS